MTYYVYVNGSFFTTVATLEAVETIREYWARGKSVSVVEGFTL